MPMGEVIRLQQEACARAGSSLYARILDAIADDFTAGGPSEALLAAWSANGLADAIAGSGVAGANGHRPRYATLASPSVPPATPQSGPHDPASRSGSRDARGDSALRSAMASSSG